MYPDKPCGREELFRADAGAIARTYKAPRQSPMPLTGNKSLLTFAERTVTELFRNAKRLFASIVLSTGESDCLAQVPKRARDGNPKEN
jgi:hypothetical protein